MIQQGLSRGVSSVGIPRQPLTGFIYRKVCNSDARFRVPLDSGSDSDYTKIQKSDSGLFGFLDSDSGFDSRKKLTDSGIGIMHHWWARD